jgi:hypothetical protein
MVGNHVRSYRISTRVDVCGTTVTVPRSYY